MLNFKIPNHIAIIMDGNGRWAKKRFLPRVAGHIKGVQAVKKTVKACVKNNIKHLTLFAFSSENWKRPNEEVNFLMMLLQRTLVKEAKNLAKESIKLHIIGNLDYLSKPIQKTLHNIVSNQVSDEKTILHLTVAINYGGKWDIINAFSHWLDEAKQNNKNLNELTAPSIQDLELYLSMSCLPNPDLMIRTGGEQRISNFLLWQMAYTELYFTDQYWPDFNDKSLDDAIQSYNLRERRFGKTSEQIQTTNKE